ncbi:MAG: MBL fold metallo-hydrolase [Clostridiales bacterium]|jgi:glyoxylase-like metal-dependent hydrolase (beta-lactamase superfamily II)|nr:MBL fold metallo-hydrolase [Clostridiales bacterium]
MRIAENVEMLSISVNRPNADMALHMTLTWDDDNLVLIDAGVPGQGEAIARAIADAGFDVKNVTHIIITHQDMDHIGSIPELLRMAPGAKLVAHRDEAPYMDGRKMPVRLVSAIQRYDNLPPEGKAQVEEGMRDYGEKKFRLKIDRELADKEVLPICGGIEAVHTPGHMPGHIALFLHQSRIMVCGDAANIEGGQIAGPNPVHTSDMKTGMLSLEKIKGYAMKGIVAYHGGYLDME